MTSLERRPRQTIDLLRLLPLLESRAQHLQMPLHTDPEQWYWDLKSLETTVRHAKTILDALDADPGTAQMINQIIAQHPTTLKHRLHIVQARIQDALQACPPPTPPASPPLRSRIKPPSPPSLPITLKTPSPSPPSPPPSKPINKQTLITEETKNTQQEEEITKELSEMANQLKKNVYNFGSLLDVDKNMIEKNLTLLECNEEKMKLQGNRLNQLVLNGNSLTTWFTILAVLGVCLAWFLMFFIIRFS